MSSIDPYLTLIIANGVKLNDWENLWGLADIMIKKPHSGNNGARFRAVKKLFYITTSLILKIGRNMATTMVPIMPPMNTINKGSIMEVSPDSMASTSVS